MIDDYYYTSNIIIPALERITVLLISVCSVTSINLNTVKETIMIFMKTGRGFSNSGRDVIYSPY